VTSEGLGITWPHTDLLQTTTTRKRTKKRARVTFFFDLWKWEEARGGVGENGGVQVKIWVTASINKKKVNKRKKERGRMGTGEGATNPFKQGSQRGKGNAARRGERKVRQRGKSYSFCGGRDGNKGRLH